MPLLKTDLYVSMKACCNGNLAELSPTFEKNKCAVTVVLASGGYPGTYKKGIVIEGTDVAKVGSIVSTLQCLTVC